MTRNRAKPTGDEMAVLLALGHTGNVKAAAQQLQITERTAHRRLERLCRRFNVETPIQVAFLVLKPGVQISPLLRSNLSATARSTESERPG
jgi:DNA-binding NarL/FixJ family response regulator